MRNAAQATVDVGGSKLHATTDNAGWVAQVCVKLAMTQSATYTSNN